MTYKLYYQKDATAHPDFKAETIAKNLKYSDVYTSTDNVVWWAVCMIAEGTLSNVEVYFENEQVHFTEHGEIIHHPVGFMNSTAGLGMRTIKACLARRQKNNQGNV